MPSGRGRTVYHDGPKWWSEITGRLIRECVAELLAMALFVFFGCGSVVALYKFDEGSSLCYDATTGLPVLNATYPCPDATFDKSGPPNYDGVAQAFGLAITVLVYSIAHISGGHINPMVTLAFFLLGKMTVLKTGLFWVAQTLGAVLGAAILLGATNFTNVTNLGTNSLSAFVTTGNAFLFELMGTALLITVVLLTAVDTRSVAKNAAPLAIGLSVWVAHSVLIPFTGCGINPSRTIGPLIVVSIVNAMDGDLQYTLNVNEQWSNYFWSVYVAGPVAGTLLAVAICKYVYYVENTSKLALTKETDVGFLGGEEHVSEVIDAHTKRSQAFENLRSGERAGLGTEGGIPLTASSDQIGSVKIGVDGGSGRVQDDDAGKDSHTATDGSTPMKYV